MSVQWKSAARGMACAGAAAVIGIAPIGMGAQAPAAGAQAPARCWWRARRVSSRPAAVHAL